jgi:hypothetical protein
MSGRIRLEGARDPGGWLRSPRFRCLDFEWSTLGNAPELLERLTTLYEP